MSPVLVFGANGQVGASLVDILGVSGVGFTRFEADFSQPDSVIRVLETIKPRCVINAAAYTHVDMAEKEEDLAIQINAVTPGLIAGYCYDHAIPFIHYSTDYVFNGKGERPWTEADVTEPLNAYGRSKLKGEQLIEAVGGKYLIFRTSWVYDHVGKNFLTTMLRLGKERLHLKVVNDQYGAPTYARDLAQASLQVVMNAIGEENFPWGMYHLCHGGVTTWYHFADMIFHHAKQAGIPLVIETLDPIKSTEYPTPAKRPANSRLDCSKAKQLLGVSLPLWQEGLTLCMERVI
ncbi:MAG: dTDP-4-dehydrorhamnose reductase [Alphaproteobacteria bacterium]|nr:dTDP-4-dehydrorhamnose reductase [Alphaproteobacteria bacterium]